MAVRFLEVMDMNRKLIGVGVGIALLAIAIPTNVSSHTSDTFTYIAPHTQSWVIWDSTPTAGIARGVGFGPGITIWCAAGGHAYTPIGPTPGAPPAPSGSGPGGAPADLTEAEDYVTAVDTWELGVEGWLFSGEPECLAGDVATGNGVSAISGGANVLNPGGATDHFGTTVTIDVIEPIGERGFTTFISMSLFCTPSSVDNANGAAVGDPTLDRPCPSSAQGDYPGSDISYACQDNEAIVHPVVHDTAFPSEPRGNGLCDSVTHRECDDSTTPFDIPEAVPDHFQTTTPALKLMWTSVHALFVDLTTATTVCVSTTGDVDTTY